MTITASPCSAMSAGHRGSHLGPLRMHMYLGVTKRWYVFRQCRHDFLGNLVGLLDRQPGRKDNREVGMHPMAQPARTNVMHREHAGNVEGCVLDLREDLRLDPVHQPAPDRQRG